MVSCGVVYTRFVVWSTLRTTRTAGIIGSVGVWFPADERPPIPKRGKVVVLQGAVMIGGRVCVAVAAFIIEVYCRSCDERGLSVNTVSWYRWHLERGRDWLIASRGLCHACDFLTCEGVETYYRSTGDLSRNTRRYMVAAWRAFGTWLEGYGVASPAVGLVRPRVERRLPRVLSPADTVRLVACCESESRRERAIVLLLLDGGLRVEELCSLDRVDLDLLAGQVCVCSGKGGKGRVVFISERTCAAVGAYLAEHDCRAVFVAERRPHNRLTPDGVRQLLQRLAARHGFEVLNPHLLRRTCGTRLVANGVDLSTVADQFGHADISTTRIYARLADGLRRDVVRRASPVDWAVSRGAGSECSR